MMASVSKELDRINVLLNLFSYFAVYLENWITDLPIGAIIRQDIKVKSKSAINRVVFQETMEMYLPFLRLEWSCHSVIG